MSLTMESHYNKDVGTMKMTLFIGQNKTKQSIKYKKVGPAKLPSSWY